MTTAKQIVETGELSGRVLGIIGAYGMGTASDTRPKTVPEAPQPEQPKSRANGSPRSRRTRKE
jgi:hypothetical protein